MGVVGLECFNCDWESKSLFSLLIASFLLQSYLLKYIVTIGMQTIMSGLYTHFQWVLVTFITYLPIWGCSGEYSARCFLCLVQIQAESGTSDFGNSGVGLVLHHCLWPGMEISNEWIRQNLPAEKWNAEYQQLFQCSSYITAFEWLKELGAEFLLWSHHPKLLPLHLFTSLPGICFFWVLMFIQVYSSPQAC